MNTKYENMHNNLNCYLSYFKSNPLSVTIMKSIHTEEMFVPSVLYVKYFEI